MTRRSVSPVAVGGVGGSGTRVVADALQQCGWYLGSDLNEAGDNLWFTLLFKHLDAVSMPDAGFDRLVDIFVSRMRSGRVAGTGVEQVVGPLGDRVSEQHSGEWLAERAGRLLDPDRGAMGGSWGWKEPNTHLVLDRLDRAIADLRYVHVARSGLDMALSDNQNQPRLWGALLGAPYDGTQRASLRYWCAAHRRVRSIGEAMGDRFLFVRYEDLCGDPQRELRRLFEFCGISDPDRSADLLAARVRPPSAPGRGLHATGFDPDDVAYVASLGFPTPGGEPGDVGVERGAQVSGGRPAGAVRQGSAKGR